MMKFSSVSLFVVVMGVSAAFAGEFQPTGELSHFDQLVLNFDAGTLPAESAIAGIWSGRCYTPGSSTPSGWILAAKTVIFTPGNGVDNGPLFPPPAPVQTFNIALINHGGLSETANRYDNPSQSDLNELQNYLGGQEFVQKLGSQVSGGALVSKNVSGGTEFRTRQFQGYFVMKTLYLADSGEHKAGETVAACYFFKKIAP